MKQCKHKRRVPLGLDPSDPITKVSRVAAVWEWCRDCGAKRGTVAWADGERIYGRWVSPGRRQRRGNSQPRGARSRQLSLLELELADVPLTVDRSKRPRMVWMAPAEPMPAMASSSPATATPPPADMLPSLRVCSEPEQAGTSLMLDTTTQPETPENGQPKWSPPGCRATTPATS